MAENITELIGRVALRDRSAFRALYAATSAKLFGVCLRILRDRAEAEDALQEIFVRIWNNADRFTASDTSPMSWLIAVARNHAIDRIRARKPQAVDIDEAVGIADDAPSPEQEAVATDERSRIQACLETLDAARADAVRGAYMEGYSYQELADRHGIPVNTMRTWLRRSLMKLKECLTQ
ncbi:sigma-70 family RNA polymerase sigma factor [Halovulum dunhuangense]|uniref:Sigma-70 family RNA polymerase sigma factor n=1 Tax=Halovulum dunhuangense TaxID=1505036 RepID=A0A849KYR3_9RHOB|nr:sigma-70 family RNA polymerase sigma factor [Halovulum dunhuangense]NNU78872.1 sigma-70 family RNA polymerase sigma factor [Halovulum dunhuangense]